MAGFKELFGPGLRRRALEDLSSWPAQSKVLVSIAPFRVTVHEATAEDPEGIATLARALVFLLRGIKRIASPARLHWLILM